jgi:hypothetical protein
LVIWSLGHLVSESLVIWSLGHLVSESLVIWSLGHWVIWSVSHCCQNDQKAVFNFNF